MLALGSASSTIAASSCILLAISSRTESALPTKTLIFKPVMVSSTISLGVLACTTSNAALNINSDDATDNSATSLRTSLAGTGECS